MQYPPEVSLLKNHILRLPRLDLYSICIDHGEMSHSLADKCSQQGGSPCLVENIYFHSDLGDPEAGAVRLCVWGGVGGGHL